jgi:integrase
MGGARAEERRLLAELERTGTLTTEPLVHEKEACPLVYTFDDAVRHFRKTRMATLKPSTRVTYEDRLDRILTPRFGNKALRELGMEAAQVLDSELAKSGLSPSSRRNMQIALRTVIRGAVEAGMLESMPKFPKLPKVGRKAVNPLHRQDLEAVLAVSSPQARLAFSLAAFAGLRAGEVRGLRWSDIDLVGKTVTVRRTISRNEESTPKSGDHRVIPIAEPLKAQLDQAILTRKGPWAPVALTSFGKLWGESGLNQNFIRAQERASRKGWSFHDLRHFFVTELFRLGVPAPTVRLLAGHADLTTTQRYADMAASDLRDAVDRFGGNSWATVG